MGEAGPRLKAPLVVLTVLVFHLTLFPRVRVFGVMPDVMLLLAVAGGAMGPAQGAALGFMAGMTTDLFLTTPLGLSALVFSLVGYAVGAFRTGLLRASWWFPLLVAALGSAAGTVLYAVVASMLGESGLLTSRLTVVVIVVAVANAMLATPVFRLVQWALHGSEPRTRVTVA